MVPSYVISLRRHDAVVIAPLAVPVMSGHPGSLHDNHYIFVCLELREVFQQMREVHRGYLHLPCRRIEVTHARLLYVRVNPYYLCLLHLSSQTRRKSPTTGGTPTGSGRISTDCGRCNVCSPHISFPFHTGVSAVYPSVEELLL